MGIPETIGYYPGYQGLEKVSNHMHRWKKITGSDGATVAVPVRRGAAATALDQGAEIGADRLGATAQSPSVLLAS